MSCAISLFTLLAIRSWHGVFNGGSVFFNQIRYRWSVARFITSFIMFHYRFFVLYMYIDIFLYRFDEYHWNVHTIGAGLHFIVGWNTEPLTFLQIVTRKTTKFNVRLLWFDINCWKLISFSQMSKSTFSWFFFWFFNHAKTERFRAHYFHKRLKASKNVQCSWVL